jgi:serine/threonine-protein kinase
VSDSLGPDEVTRLTDPMVMRAQTRVGQVIKEKWRLDVLLGVGGMAAVYAATHRNGSRVAIKLLHPELSTHHEVRTRFLREGYVANAVGHEGAVRITDDDVAEDGAAFLVMELLDGETLEDRRVRSGGRLDEDEVLSLADQLLDVLAAAHAKGIVHRDIKPDNVFVTRTGQVKLLDYGIARLREVTSKSTATVSGATMGTPAFMSPEQARALWDEVDARSDLWAVGATMFNLLTGRLVHEGRTTNEQLLHAMTKEPAPLESVLPSATPAVCHVVNRALSFEKDRRWRDAGRMQEAARGAYYDRFGKPITTSPRLVVPESVPNRTLANIPIALVPLAPRLPTTGQPVEAARNATTVSGSRSRNQLAAVLVAGVVGLGVTASAVVWVVSSAHRSAPATLGSVRTELPAAEEPAAVSAPAPLPAASSAPATPAPPVIAATDLPTAATQAPPQPIVAPTPTPIVVSTAAPPVATSPPRAIAPVAVPATSKPANCPPYTFDHQIPPKKIFHPECMK